MAHKFLTVSPHLSTSFATNSPNGDDTQSITYDATTGNIISKSDLGLSSEFSYDSSLKPHALRSVSGITNNWGSTDVSINYTDFGKVELIQRGGDSYSIFYGTDKERFLTRETISGITTTRCYMPNYEIVTNSLGEENYIIYLCNGSIVIYDKASSTYMLCHGYYDAQGSLIALTDDSGHVLARYAYDPWGKRVNPTDWTQGANAPTALNLKRGYTMHEHLDEFELINMNGRVYDPAVAQFLSPDPYIQDGGNWLNYNRYAYCYNNPTRYVDPDGEIITETLVFAGIMALFQGAVNLGMQMYKGNVNDFWDGLTAFGIGAVSGAVSSLGGQLTFGLGGFWGGFVAGAQSGLYSSFLQGLGNYRLLGDEKLDGWDVAVSTISGGLTVGLVNGFVSYYGNGLSFWSGKAVYPENNGFQEGFVPQKVTLEKGQLIDRYGATSQFSDFVGDPNATIPQRSLSPYTNTSEYTLYQVTGDVNALKGPIAPAFKQPGGGIQYKLEVPISYLIKEGKLIIIYHSK